MASNRTGTAGSTEAIRWSALSVFALAVLAIDQALKESVRAAFAPGEGTHLFGSYSIQHVQNEGIAGGGLQGRALPLAVLSMIAVLLLYEYLSRRGFSRASLIVGFGLLIGGGLGNLVDRARHGLVTDFIRNGPNAFNVADIAIFLGGVIILAGLVASLLSRRGSQPTSSGG
jgi:signal peptidase II